jgi:hypothetical protein
VTRRGVENRNKVKKLWYDVIISSFLFSSQELILVSLHWILVPFFASKIYFEEGLFHIFLNYNKQRNCEFLLIVQTKLLEI